MTKTIDAIKITDEKTFFTIFNTRSSAFFTIFKEEGHILFRDSFGNILQCGFCYIKTNENIEFELNEIGETIRDKNGTTIALLSQNDVLELAEQTFYEAGQTRIYDFINQRFKIDLD
jgi:hypothetical protein